MSRMLAIFICVLGLPAALPGQQQAPQYTAAQLNSVLQDWYTHSRTIKTLEGQHQRFIYEKTFGVEKRAQGLFYYESPDKGRIDLEAVTIPSGAVSQKTDPKTKRPYSLSSDTPQKWICDGKQIKRVDDHAKEVEIFKIPPQGQGQNIMNGPLPFLFGMPPEIAKRRYQLTLMKVTTSQIWLYAEPKWKQDAANYRNATVILDRNRYLPIAVKLIDPSGSQETVYTFRDLKVDKPRGVFILSKNPLELRIPSDYKLVQNTVAREPQKVANLPPQQPRQYALPSVVNLPWKSAKARLESVGCKVKLVPGRAVNQKEFHYVVYQQSPLPKTLVGPGTEVTLTVYDDPNRKKQ